MYCNKCGKEISENALFCSGCGAKIEREDAGAFKNEKKEQENVGKNKQYKYILPCIVAGIVIVVAVLVIVYFFKLGRSASIENAEVTDETADLCLYDVTIDEIDVYAEKRQPNARNDALRWDSTLFYFLEDIGPENTDGQIEFFDVTRRQLRNAKTGNLIEYEIYTNPATGKIHKIVSIEQFEYQLEIIDYYYTDTGEINFIYKRNDSVYTPTYATPDKTGERYYFNNDTMVKWRWVNEPRQVEQVVLQYDETNASYSQHLYNEISDGGKESYDAMEKQMINAAYNTYDAISNSEDYGNIKGYVLDEDGAVIADAKVEVCAGERILGELRTDSAGYYETGISFYENGYELKISANGYEEENIYQVVVKREDITTWVDTMCLTVGDKEKHQIMFTLYDGDALTSDEDGNAVKTGVANAKVVIRKGINHVNGEEVVHGVSDENGKLALELPNGVYTAEIIGSDYVTVRQNFVVTGDSEIALPLVAALGENQLKVVLTWDGKIDVDAFLFTPDKSANGDMAYINARNASDETGNLLNYDCKDGQGAEIIYIEDKTRGTYKYYVSDYTNCMNGNLNVSDMLNVNIQVAVYDKSGLVTSFTMPENLSGVVWEVFEVKNGKVIALQHSYSNLDGKEWWFTDKEKFGDTSERDERLRNLPDSIYEKVSPEAATTFFNDVLPWKVTAELISCEETEFGTKIIYKASNTDAVAMYSIGDEYINGGYYHPDYEYLYGDSGWNEYGSDYPVVYFTNGVPSNNEEIYDKIYDNYLGGSFCETDYVSGDSCTLRDVETGEVFTISLVSGPEITDAFNIYTDPDTGKTLVDCTGALDSNTYYSLYEACEDYTNTHDISVYTGYQLLSTGMQYFQVSTDTAYETLNFYIDPVTLRTAATADQLRAADESEGEYEYRLFDSKTSTYIGYILALGDSCMLNVHGNSCIWDIFQAYYKFCDDGAGRIYLAYAGNGIYEFSVGWNRGTIEFMRDGFEMSYWGETKWFPWSDYASYIEEWD